MHRVPGQQTVQQCGLAGTHGLVAVLRGAVRGQYLCGQSKPWGVTGLHGLRVVQAHIGAGCRHRRPQTWGAQWQRHDAPVPRLCKAIVQSCCVLCYVRLTL